MVLRQGLGLQVASTNVGSPSTLPTVSNFWIQTGSLVTAAGSTGFVAFGTPMPSTDYYVQLTPVNTGHNAVAQAGSFLPYISGVRHVSGVNVIGGPAARYDYIAVG